MTYQIIPFENAELVAGSNASFALNALAEEFASVNFPVISIKGGRFHIKREGVKTLITRPKHAPTDPDEPASYIDMTVLNLQKAKTFYLEGYVEGSEEKPDCFSNDGVSPDAVAQTPQCATCALCPHNAWGSGVNDKGEATKGKACSDTLRLAIASPANLDDPYMLRVPPASLKAFAEVSKWLSSHNVPLNRAVIRIGFDTDKTGVLSFKAIGGVDAATFAKASALMNSELVLQITGKSLSGSQRIAAVGLPAPETPKAVTAPKAVKPKKVEQTPEEKSAAEKAAKIAKLLAEMAALEAGDEVPKKGEQMGLPLEAPAPKETKKTPVVNSSNFDSELADLLA